MNEPQPEDSQLPTPFELSMIAAQFYSPSDGVIDEQDDGHGDVEEDDWTPRSNPAHAALAAFGLWQACDRQLRAETKCPWPADIPRPGLEEYPLDYSDLLTLMPEDIKTDQTKKRYLSKFLESRKSRSLPPASGWQRLEGSGIGNEREWRSLATALKDWVPQHQQYLKTERSKKGVDKRYHKDRAPGKEETEESRK
jgi:hypothetical protein